MKACVFQKWATRGTRESVADPVGSLPGSWSCTGKDWQGCEDAERKEDHRNLMKILNEESNRKFMINALNLQCVLYLNLLFAVPISFSPMHAVPKQTSSGYCSALIFLSR